MIEILSIEEPIQAPVQFFVRGNGVIDCVANAGAENEVVSLLAFIGNLTSHSASITYNNLTGECEIIEQSQLKMDEGQDTLGYKTALIGKAQELIGARNFRLQLQPSKPVAIS